MKHEPIKNPKFTQDTINKMRPGHGKKFFQKALDERLGKPKVVGHVKLKTSNKMRNAVKRAHDDEGDHEYRF